MKHAYLILAHNEFPVLQLLLKAIDDYRNDIFIHFDKKVQQLPELKTKQANLKVIESRIDVRWGDASVVEAEYALFESAFESSPYAYYHLLSGVDMPLRSQNEIHDFFRDHKGKEFIGFSTGDLKTHLDRKVQRYHLFPKHFRSTGLSLQRLIRFAFLKLQYVFRIRRNKDIEFKKGTQWISITHDFVKYLLDKKEEVLKTYHHTFCADEIFVQTLCWQSPFLEQVYDLHNEGHGCMRIIGWKDNQMVEWTCKDFGTLIQSEALFARKFSSKYIEVVERILNQINRSERGKE